MNDDDDDLRPDPTCEQCQALRDEVAFVLRMLDDLADIWGDEGQFRTCRDRLRRAIEG